MIVKEKKMPIYKTLSLKLEKEIKSGKIKVGTKLPADTEMARQVGYSPVTVSKAYRILTEKGLLERIVGRGTIVKNCKKKSGIITMLCGHHSSEWSAVIASELSMVLEKHKMKLIHKNAANNDPVLEQQIVSEIDPEETDGLVVLNNWGMEVFYEDLFKQGLPVLIAGRPAKNIPYITFNDFGVGRLAAKCLLEKGHKNFAAVVEDYQIGRERAMGFICELAANGIRMPDENIMFERKIDLGTKTAEKLLALPKMPDAVFSDDESIFQQIEICLLEAGIPRSNIPKMLGAGTRYKQHPPPYSGIELNVKKMGTEAANIILSMIDLPGNELLKMNRGYLIEPEINYRDNQ